MPCSTAELFVADVVAQHDPQPDTELAPSCAFSFRKALLYYFASIEALQWFILAHRMADGFAPEEAQHRAALLRQTAERLSLSSAGELARNQADVAGHGLAICESRRIAEDGSGGECGDRADARMGHQQARSLALCSTLGNHLVEFIDLLLQLQVETHQRIAAFGRVRR